MFGNALKRAAFAAIIVFVVASTGCVTRHPPYADAVDREIVRGGASWERDNAREALGYLRESVRRTLTDIHITDSCPDYLPKYEDGRWQEYAHRHPDTEQICVHVGCVRDSVIWHEAGHALYWSRSADERAAAAISAAYYGNKGGDFPRDGILTRDGAKNAREDFAEWFEWAMCYLYHTPTGSTSVDLTLVDAADPKYLPHLEKLRDWDGISPEQYDELEPLFTVRLGGVPMK